MKKTKHMDLNRETAMRLWNKSFGKETKVKDYTGRTIAKGAYNDRNSEFGWNLDHILPQSKGGKTADYNLVCCHILTNDEKADKFPGFKANGIAFEIVKVENHYEIQQASGNKKKKVNQENNHRLNFMDSASGVRLFEKLCEKQKNQRFVGTVVVRLRRITTTAVIDFVDELFDTENIKHQDRINNYNPVAKITIQDYDMPHKADIQNLLDKCIVLNTYLRCYFQQGGYIESYDIHFQLDSYDTKTDFYCNPREISLLHSL